MFSEITWNPWYGCEECSSSCCYCNYSQNVYRSRDLNKPIQKKRVKSIVQRVEKYELEYKIPTGSIIRVCTCSDFFFSGADGMRQEAWDIIHSRPDCLFHIVTRRPERIEQCLPEMWLTGWDNVIISTAIEDQYTADIRIRQLIDAYDIGVKHLGIYIKPLENNIDIRGYIGSGFIESVIISGESYYDYDKLARVTDLSSVRNIMEICREFDIPGYFESTGSRLRVDNGSVIGVRPYDQKELAKFYKLDTNNENSIWSKWEENALITEERLLAERAYTIYKRIISERV